MKPSPLRERVLAALQKNDQINPWGLGEIVDAVLDAVAESTPAEITEEGGYLLGASHLWSDTQGTKATEHMVRRITAADQIVRSRLELENAQLGQALADVLRDVEEGMGYPYEPPAPYECRGRDLTLRLRELRPRLPKPTED